MRASWRLGSSALRARPSRALLLTAAVAMSAALITAIGAAMASVQASLGVELDERVGTAEARIRSGSGGVDADLIELARGWPEVESVSGWIQDALSFSYDTSVAGEDGAEQVEWRSGALARGVAPGVEPTSILLGRAPEAPGEVLIDVLFAERLSWLYNSADESRPSFSIGAGDVSYLDRPAPIDLTGADSAGLNASVGVRIGDTIRVRRFLRAGVELVVVGIANAPPLGGRPRCWVTNEQMRALGRDDGRVSEIEIELLDGVDAAAFTEARRAEIAAVDARALLTTTERVTSGVNKNMASSRLGLLLASALAFLSASFIILTGLTTDLAERQRELAVVRAIGASRIQMGGSQLIVGAVVGVAGALVGIPLGVGLGWALTLVSPGQTIAGLVVPWWTYLLAACGSVGCGLLGAAWPAWRASRMSVVRALSPESVAASPSLIARTTLAGLGCVLVQLALITLPDDGQLLFWGYALVGLPSMFVGYFLLGVPVTMLAATLLSPTLSKLLSLPPGVLGRSVRSTPFRHGFTAGALMGGLALMVSIWATGGAFVRDWLTRIEFPDAFVSGLALPPEAMDRLDNLDFVVSTCAISQHPVKTNTFGIKGLQDYSSWFFAFDPEPFFEMARLDWVDGDPVEGLRRLNEGGGVLVAREFRVVNGIGAGDTITLIHDDVGHEFEVVGVVTSPGLELVSKYFNIGDDFVNQAVHAVFGTRADAARIFGSDAIQLIQVELDESVSDDVAVREMRRAVFGMGVLDVGSGRAIKAQLIEFVRGSLFVFTLVAVASLLIAATGVANLIIAGIETRRREMGVLRAIGGTRGLLARLVIAEAVLVGVSAVVLGTVMGVHGAFNGAQVHKALIGLDVSTTPPPLAILIGAGIVLTISLGAAAPGIARLNRRTPLDLLASGPA